MAINRSNPSLSMKKTTTLRLPMFLFVLLLHVSSIRGDGSFENYPGYKDLEQCARNCISGCWGIGCSSGIFKAAGCDTFKCGCGLSELARELYYLAECISKDPDSAGCGSDVQQAPAEAIVRGACRKEGYNVNGVPSGGTGPTKTAEGLPTSATGTGRIYVTVTAAANHGSVASVFFGDVVLLGIFAVSSVVIPALLFL
ncbi:hypothetical protein K440DRAFT_683167 [Wilcoxina mikolae CBS 423.85]|nr:hypothetical protein K440DRAFT_683167 [Wilcoxina mikolae CBS 423.85]